jgi:hypothetical protein
MLLWLREQDSAGATLRWTQPAWALDSAGRPYLQTVNTEQDQGKAYAKQSKIVQTMDAWGNVTERKEYDFGNLTTAARKPSASVVLRNPEDLALIRRFHSVLKIRAAGPRVNADHSNIAKAAHVVTVTSAYARQRPVRACDCGEFPRAARSGSTAAGGASLL